MSATLNLDLISNKAFWSRSPIDVKMPPKQRNGRPHGLVFGVGNMAHSMTSDLKASGLALNCSDDGFMAGVETHAEQGVHKLKRHDNLVLHIVLGPNGDIGARVHNIIDPVHWVGPDRSTPGWKDYLDLARNPGVHHGTLNVPEGAYGVAVTGDQVSVLSQEVRGDMQLGTVTSHLAKWTAFALERFRHSLPFTIISCTNFTRNGHFTRQAIHAMARNWESLGLAPQGFAAYILDSRRFRCPATMVDRIAVLPNKQTAEILSKMDLDALAVVTEEPRYLVLEDVFPEGERPFREDVPGVYYEPDEAGVLKWEEMKYPTLNAAHSITASVGTLLGFRGDYSVANAMRQPQIRRLVVNSFDLVVPLLEEPSRKKPREFADEVLIRVSNPNLPDQTERIALNGSTKIYPRFTSSLLKHLAAGGSMESAKPFLFSVAAMLRYMTGVDDEGNSYTLSDDPRMPQILNVVGSVVNGVPATSVAFRPMIADATIMGVDLYTLGDAGNQVERMIGTMLNGPGSVRRLLDEVVS